MTCPLELHEIASSYLQTSQHHDCYALMTKHADAPPAFRQALLDTLAEYLAAYTYVNNTEGMSDDLYDIGDFCDAIGDARIALKRDLPMSLVWSVPTLVHLAAAAYEIGEQCQTDSNPRPIEKTLSRRMGELANAIVADNT